MAGLVTVKGVMIIDQANCYFTLADQLLGKTWKLYSLLEALGLRICN